MTPDAAFYRAIERIQEAVALLATLLVVLRRDEGRQDEDVTFGLVDDPDEPIELLRRT